MVADADRVHEDRLATEEPLEIRVTWPGAPARRVSVTMRTPGHDFELAAGFLAAERVITGAGDFHTVAYCTDNTLSREEEFNVVTAELTRAPRHDPAERFSGTGAGSACGVCGKQSIDDVLSCGHAADQPLARQWDGFTVPWDVAVSLPDRLREAQRVFARTGGLHAAGLFEADGTPVVVREDIGRHNTVDKVVGARLLAGERPGLPLLCVSGRIGFELVQKAVNAGVAVIVAVGAPSSLAVQLARTAGLCVVGFARDQRCVVYAEPDRVRR
jgi:FdhD protein